jgi:ubiquinone/menaquinone biosynthesis C-methylase UbiE
MNRYTDAVEKHGDKACSMLDDEIVRQKETELILGFFETHVKKRGLMFPLESIVDIGCGDGCTLEKLSEKYNCNFFGIDITKELLDIAEKRGTNCAFFEGDATSLKFDDDFFDIVLTQRCLINLSSWSDQKKALNEIYRVLKPNGYYLMIEGFTDGLINNNKARMECGLPEIKAASFNRLIDKKLFFKAVGGKFSVTGESYNFLSSHYFISRVLHGLVTKGEQIKNTEFVKFFSFLPPIGNYSPLQAFILTKKGKT